MRTIALLTILLAAPAALAEPPAEEPAVTTTAPRHHKPKLAVELTGAGAYVANPYLQYQGWNLETGPGMGGRAQVEAVGITLGYELTTFSNDRACGTGCMTGDFGSTRIHELDLGYRFRFADLGPMRPFVATSLGGVLANSGTWSASTDRNMRGGQARAGLGVEIPLAGGLFASAGVFYRLIITENPLRNRGQQDANKMFIGTTATAGDYAEDFHLITLQVGIGASL